MERGTLEKRLGVVSFKSLEKGDKEKRQFGNNLNPMIILLEGLFGEFKRRGFNKRVNLKGIESIGL